MLSAKFKVFMVYFLKQTDPNAMPFDSYTEMVVVADSVDQARSIASYNAGDEGELVWLDAKKSTVEEIDTSITKLILGLSK